MTIKEVIFFFKFKMTINKKKIVQIAYEKIKEMGKNLKSRENVLSFFYQVSHLQKSLDIHVISFIFCLNYVYKSILLKLKKIKMKYKIK